MKPVTLLVVGAGDRGTRYAEFALQHPDRLRVVAVAEPRELYREQLAGRHGIQHDRIFADWRVAANHPRLADAVLIATPDAVHAEPAVIFARQGYHILLEKPMAPNEADCRQIVTAVQQAGILFGVCHVLRYTPHTRQLKQLLDSGSIGEIVSLQHLEPVGYWHFAHSYVRGNWRNTAQSSPMLLAKACHDLDWLRHIVGRRCRMVSSFGSLQHFRRENRPAHAADRCLDCDCEETCPYSAKRIYLQRIQTGQTGWPVDVLTHDQTPAGVEKALCQGPYGRCVYACDNDAVDHQVVNMEFDGGATATFTVTAFTEMAGRKTRIFGTRGCVETDSTTISHVDFLTNKSRIIDTAAGDASPLGGHGGGDRELMNAFTAAVAENNPSRILSGPTETLESHLMVFAAERARQERCVVTL